MKIVSIGYLVILSTCAVISMVAHGHQQSAEDELTAIIDAVEKGWEQGDGSPFRAHFLDFAGARYIESGGQNDSLNDLVEHHVEPEGDALGDFELDFTNPEIHIEGDFAWAVVDVELKATIKKDDRHIHKTGYETFLFRLIDGAWKVIHTHSSTREARKD